MEEIKIIKTEQTDLPEIMAIYNHARNLMISRGNYQWDEDYPTQAMIADDIEQSRHFTVKENNQILGVFVLVDYDSEYDDIDGQWLNSNDEPYVEIMRFALKKLDFKLITHLMNYVFKRCPNVKVDTGEDNTGVQRLLERNNFKYCGRLKDPESKERVTWLAYQKIQ